FENFESRFQTDAKDISLDELGFLMVTEQLENPKKSEVIALNLFEPTTGTEILRRLIQMGLVSQQDNPRDKRSKVLRVTAKGREVIDEAIKYVKRVGTLMGLGLDEQQKRHLNLLLTFLNARHGRIFLRQRAFDLNQMLGVSE
ncbi:MAG: winged helix DNA-binding protein, partial [Bacteroidia bacterium]|nr:winged helix DNA-binding protein [Bacteroidia bacterium]